MKYALAVRAPAGTPQVTVGTPVLLGTPWTGAFGVVLSAFPGRPVHVLFQNGLRLDFSPDAAELVARNLHDALLAVDRSAS